MDSYEIDDFAKDELAFDDMFGDLFNGTFGTSRDNLRPRGPPTYVPVPTYNPRAPPASTPVPTFNMR